MAERGSDRQLERGKFRPGFDFGGDAPRRSPWLKRLIVLAVIAFLGYGGWFAARLLVPAATFAHWQDRAFGLYAKTRSDLGLGYREIYVPPRAMTECLKESGGVINEQTMRCRNGYSTWVRKP